MPFLHWLTREEDIHRAALAPYRLLEEAPDLSHGDRDTGNMLIQGDNLDALKALLPYYAGKVKCVFIDPPYNTRSAFEHYDDNLEHSQWLAMMYPQMKIICYGHGFCACSKRNGFERSSGSFELMEIFSRFCSRNSVPTEWGFSGVEDHRFFYLSQ